MTLIYLLIFSWYSCFLFYFFLSEHKTYILYYIAIGCLFFLLLFLKLSNFINIYSNYSICFIFTFFPEYFIFSFTFDSFGLIFVLLSFFLLFFSVIYSWHIKYNCKFYFSLILFLLWFFVNIFIISDFFFFFFFFFIIFFSFFFLK